MREHPMETAISEQLRGFIPVDDLDKKKLKSRIVDCAMRRNGVREGGRKIS
jgi:hypothetical protein